jgi:hypothetical protein
MDDRQLLAVLRGALAADQPDPSGEPDVPPGVLDAARAAWSWRTVDEELARLVYDSADDPALAGVRGPADHRQLTFQSASVTLEIELVERRLLGQIAPGPAVHVRLWTVPDGPRDVDVDERGRFVVAGLPPGPVRLSYAFGDGAPGTTGWILP